MSTPSAADLAAATPASRDRYVDFLRVAALASVMLGHYLMAGVLRGPGGQVVVTNSLVEVPPARLLTWVFQVMPVFFVVGGFSHATAIPSLRRRGGTYADFALSRCRRLLEPTLAFVTFGVLAAVLVEISGPPNEWVEFALRLIGQPLWFVGIYLFVVAMAPWMLRLHVRFGVKVIAALLTIVVVVDVLRLGFDVPLVGYLNFLLVWLAIHQFGFFYADGRLLDRRVGWSMAVAGYTTAVVLVALLPYPLSMVSLTGERVSNLAPPSVALVAMAAGQIGVLVLIRDPVSRWLTRARVWTVVVAANGVVMTTFLWHLTAIVVVNAVIVQTGLPTPQIGTIAWWFGRLLILPFVIAVLAGLVAVFRRFEAPHATVVPPEGERRRHRDGLGAAGIVLAIIGILGFSMTGFTGITTFETQTLVVVPVTPFLNLVLLLLGWWIVQFAASPRRPSARSAGPSARAGPTSGRDHSR
ncbi:MAG: acyltransferase [Actinomycetes bacterium]